jgi:orotidine-5'-phosphate decarboxylase
MEPKDRIIVALDVPTVEQACDLVNQLNPFVGYFKIGLEFIYSLLASLLKSDISEAGDLLKKARELFSLLGLQTFLDVKLNDIPNTVKGASVAVSRIGAKMFNVHASAGSEAVRQAVANSGNSRVLGVTVLTSIDETECISIFGDKPGKKVLQFAKMLAYAGAYGIICSPQELELLKQHEEFCCHLVKATPGVRPEWAKTNDQKRIMTPREAIKAGADHLVIGRPITYPPESIGTPVDAAQRIAEEIASALEKGVE